jgi:hypothetical protein
MSFSYVGLLAAALSEIVTRLPNAPFTESVALASGLVFAIGAFAISRRARPVLAALRTRPSERSR